MWACEHFKIYLLGIQFRLITDHKPLVSLFDKPTYKPTPRLERWSLRLQAFDFALEYRPGCNNIADPLSRLSVYETESIQPLSDDIHAVAELAVPCAMKWSDIQEAAKSCEATQSIGGAIASGDWSRCSAIVKSVNCICELYIVNCICVSVNSVTVMVWFSGETESLFLSVCDRRCSSWPMRGTRVL